MSKNYLKIDEDSLNKTELKKVYTEMVTKANKRINDYMYSNGKVSRSFEQMATELGEKLGNSRGSNYLSTRTSGMGANELRARVIALKEFYAFDRVTKQAKKEIDKKRVEQYRGFQNMFGNGFSTNDFKQITDVFGSLAAGELERLGYAYLTNQFLSKVKGKNINMTEVLDSVMGERQRKYKMVQGHRQYYYIRKNKFNGTRTELRDAIIKELKKRM